MCSSDLLPAGFSYTPGSTTGATTNDPTIDGQILTWSGSFNVPGRGSTLLYFAVKVAATPGDYFNEVGGSAESNYNVISTGPTAEITVTAAATPTPRPPVDESFQERFTPSLRDRSETFLARRRSRLDPMG